MVVSASETGAQGEVFMMHPKFGSVNLSFFLIYVLLILLSSFFFRLHAALPISAQECVALYTLWYLSSSRRLALMRSINLQENETVRLVAHFCFVRSCLHDVIISVFQFCLQARGSSGEHSEVIDRIDISNWRRIGFPE